MQALIFHCTNLLSTPTTTMATPPPTAGPPVSESASEYLPTLEEVTQTQPNTQSNTSTKRRRARAPNKAQKRQPRKAKASTTTSSADDIPINPELLLLNTPTPAPNPKPPAKPRMQWTSEMEEALVVEGHIQFVGGKGADAGNWKPEGWSAIIASVQEACQKPGVVVELRHVRNKWGEIKEHWKTWSVLEGTSGMGWSEEEELYKGPDNIWQTLEQVSLFILSLLLSSILIII